VPEFTLTSAPPLAGINKAYGDMELSAPDDVAIVSIALPLGGKDAAFSAVKSAYGVAMPAVGKTAASKNGETLMRLSTDLAFVVFTHATPDAEPVVAGKMKGKAYTTDQTDVWCALQLDGPGAMRALERICPLDLKGFAIGDVARTAMEHLGTIIVRTDTNSWLLLSASSSAGSFLHAVETSIKNVS